MKQLLVRSGKVFLKEVPAPLAGPKNVLVQVDRSCVSVGTEMAGIKMSGLPLYRRALKQPHHVKRVVQLMRDQGVARVYKQVMGKLDAGPIAAEPDIRQDQVDLLLVQRLDRIVEMIECRDDLIAGVRQQHFMVEGRERFVLDDEDSVDDPLSFPEQHPDPL